MKKRLIFVFPTALGQNLQRFYFQKQHCGSIPPKAKKKMRDIPVCLPVCVSHLPLKYPRCLKCCFCTISNLTQAASFTFRLMSSKSNASPCHVAFSRAKAALLSEPDHQLNAFQPWKKNNLLLLWIFLNISTRCCDALTVFAWSVRATEAAGKHFRKPHFISLFTEVVQLSWRSSIQAKLNLMLVCQISLWP